MSEEVKKVEDYRCPNCKEPSSDEPLAHTESKFLEEPDPHYSWIEIHQCQKCETIYQFRNST